ncbi:MAG TPA: ABC transporter ATP-binding protein [Caldilineaceae bacterium]|nr:ABC transporter ATP-binding protein [Caldilineaceae bacterium]
MTIIASPISSLRDWIGSGSPGQTESAELVKFAWPLSRLGEAVECLAHHGGLASTQPQSLTWPLFTANIQVNYEAQVDNETLERWLTIGTAQLDLEVESVQVAYAEVDRLVQGAGPMLVRLPLQDMGTGEGGPHFLALLRGKGGNATLIGPDRAVHRVSPYLIRDALCADLERSYDAELDQLLEVAEVSSARQADVRQALLQVQLGSQLIGDCWLLRLSPAAGVGQQMAQIRLRQRLALLVIGYLVQVSLTILAWGVIGRSSLAGHFDWGWLQAWALVLFSAVPLQMFTNWFFSRLVVDVGVLFKQRLLFGALQLAPEEIRHQGAGQFLGRVMETVAVERLALAGGFRALLALIQLGAAAVILAIGAGGWLHALLLVVWTGFTVGLSLTDLHVGRAWTDAFRTMTNDLVERMVGHRTRLAQEDRRRWHAGEDQLLDTYILLSQKLNRVETQLDALIPRGWMVLGMVSVLGVFFLPVGWRNADTAANIAISLGGVLMAYQALVSITIGLQSVVDARLAWTQVEPLFYAAERVKDERVDPMGIGRRLMQQVGQETGRPQVSARELAFRYDGHNRYVLRDCTFQIVSGERWLLTGPSGSGKSTLAALLAGLRRPESGTLLLGGLDCDTIGVAEWRRRVVVVPQFHENHLFTGTLGFNLLMGREWPASAAALTEAETICWELGLGDLLTRMPAGMQQMVGESGWRLSHGERSRIYIGRALLQDADLLILDESFGALDPETMQLAADCVLRRAKTLVVIAHP